MKQIIGTFFNMIVYTISHWQCYAALLIAYFIFHTSIELALVIAFALGAILYGIFGAKKVKVNRLKKQATGERNERYKSFGMTKDEIRFFRETMNTAKEQIEQFADASQKTSRLKTIEYRNNTIRLARQLFKGITDEPLRLHEVDQFLYVHLPSLVELTEKYNTIDAHELKDKDTYQTLGKCADTIDAVSQLIKQDYHDFFTEDLEDAEIEITLAEQKIQEKETKERSQ